MLAPSKGKSPAKLGFRGSLEGRITKCLKGLTGRPYPENSIAVNQSGYLARSKGLQSGPLCTEGPTVPVLVRHPARCPSGSVSAWVSHPRRPQAISFHKHAPYQMALHIAQAVVFVSTTLDLLKQPCRAMQISHSFPGR